MKACWPTASQADTYVSGGPEASVFALLCAAPAFATGSSDSKRLRDAVGIKGLLAHEAALETIGTLSGGNRLAGTKGYDGSALYVGATSAFAGLRVSDHEFDYELDVVNMAEVSDLLIESAWVPGTGMSMPGPRPDRDVTPRRLGGP